MYLVYNIAINHKTLLHLCDGKHFNINPLRHAFQACQRKKSRSMNSNMSVDSNLVPISKEIDKPALLSSGQQI